MATPVLSTPESVKHPLIASPWHTLFLIVAQGLLSFRSKMQASHAHVLGDRIGLYERTIFFEWLMFALMILGGATVRPFSPCWESAGGPWDRCFAILASRCCSWSFRSRLNRSWAHTGTVEEITVLRSSCCPMAESKPRCG